MKKVSVIIPVYNAAAYLDACIRSIAEQEYENKEIILIDDGSTDSSPELCDSWAEKESTVRVLHQENAGIGAARNAGLQIALGEYIVFVDADDYLLHNAVFSAMADKLNREAADIAVTDYVRLWNGKLLETIGHNSFSTKDRESGEFRFQGFFSTGVLSYVWGKMYRRTFLEEHQIAFGEYTYAEDKIFNCLCYSHGAKYAFVQDTTYVYRKNDASVSYHYREDSVECWLNLAQDLQCFLEKEGKDCLYQDLTENIIFFASFFDGKMIYLEKQHSLSAVKEILKKYREDPLAAHCFKEMAAGRGLRKIPSVLWKVMIWGFSVGMHCKWYFLLAWGIKLLVDGRIDERLSDTGLREHDKKGRE